ncbi:hypothetical protein TCAL_04496 [Tigriopus californicus]|uniref:Uncharacterized protein n=1 Tax=Tigriopus californicus TaxID=6832 RepID=A0A553P066_TIGCA|nr:membrane-associated protein Hem-like [Tigriopus californicus]TRY71086.1 hypothetical protein TCAL_04496 [Tigriopus californicus]|eukprot:TCALIF_04496-PA protein Name:"Similar to NCKAP1 Nck-associated protein 1 (Homo sapiens)" AED:0.09 eAED:0.10 QI:2/1/0.4/1/1/0.8/5/0/1349
MLRLAEKLLLYRHKAEGLLLRLYHLKQELSDANSDLSFLHEKCFSPLSKALSATRDLRGFQPSSKHVEEIEKMRPKIRKYLALPHDTLLDVYSLCSSSLLELFQDCRVLSLDSGRSPQLTSLYLDLVVLYGSLLILLARMPERNLICILMCFTSSQGGSSSGEASVSALPTTTLESLGPRSTTDRDFHLGVFDFMERVGRPLVLMYHSLRPFQATVKGAFLSSVCLAFVGQRKSSEQWRSEEFLSIQTMVGTPNPSTEDQVAMTSCMGYPIGLEMVHLERIEQWMFFSFLICHFVIDFNHKDAGEYRIWSMLLQGMWVLPIIRDEVIWVHEELGQFFKAIKGQKGEDRVSKKANEMKILYATATRSAPYYHFQRRLYLTSLLKHYSTLLRDCPALLGPRILHVLKVCSLSQDELYWLLAHHANKPNKLSSEAERFLQIDYEVLELMFHLDEIRQMVQKFGHKVAHPYFEAYITTFDIPALQETLLGEIAKINDPDINSHPMQITLQSLMGAIHPVGQEQSGRDKSPVNPLSEDEKQPEALDNPFSQPPAASGVQPPRNERVTKITTEALQLDCLRLQVFLVTTNFQKATESSLSDSKSSTDSLHRRPKSPPTALTRQIDALLSHLALLKSSGQPDQDVESAARPSVLFDDPISSALTLARLAAGYPDILKRFFSHVINGNVPGTTMGLAIAFPCICAHPEDLWNPMCPEDYERLAKAATENAKFFLRQICAQLFKHFRAWLTYQNAVTRSTEASNGAALKVALKMASRRTKDVSETSSALSEVMKSRDDMINRGTMTAAFGTMKNALQLEGAVFPLMMALSFTLNRYDEMRVFSCRFRPLEFFLQTLEADFIAGIGAILKIERGTLNTPTNVLSHVEDYIWCLLSLGNHVSGVDMPLICLGLLNMMQRCSVDQHMNASLGESVQQYLESYFSQVIKPLVWNNTLVFSETFKCFVLPSCLDVTKKDLPMSDVLKAFTLEDFVGSNQLEALAKVFGTAGIEVLKSRLLHELIFKDLRELQTVTMASRNEAIPVSTTLSLGIRLGVSLSIHDLLDQAVGKVSRERLPHLCSVLEDLISEDHHRQSDDETDNGIQEMASLMGLHPSPRSNFNVAELIHREALFEYEDLLHLMQIFSHAIPYSGLLTSSLFIGETTNARGEKICIDGHFNNLNCLAQTVSQLFSVLFYLTRLPVDEDHAEDIMRNQDERHCFEAFLSLLAKKLVDFQGRGGSTTKDSKSNQESVLLLLSLIIEHCPTVDHDVLNKIFPLPIKLLHRARERIGRSEHDVRFQRSFQALSLTDKCIESSELSRRELSTKSGPIMIQVREGDDDLQIKQNDDVNEDEDMAYEFVNDY